MLTPREAMREAIDNRRYFERERFMQQHQREVLDWIIRQSECRPAYAYAWGLVVLVWLAQLLVLTTR